MLQFIIGILLEEGIGIRNTVKCNKEINLRPIVLQMFLGRTIYLLEIGFQGTHS